MTEDLSLNKRQAITLTDAMVAHIKDKTPLPGDVCQCPSCKVYLLTDDVGYNDGVCIGCNREIFDD